MKNPLITVLLCTVRPDNGYVDHPEWTTLGKVNDDLAKQTFTDFELIVVDGVDERNYEDTWPLGPAAARARRGAPRVTLWTQHKKVAISTYRNTGLIHARGELIVNLDDCCELPPNFLEVYALAWTRAQTCLAMTWPENGDVREVGPVDRPGMVYGFGSYPLKAAIELNGYDEAYDGGQGLEDADWSTRLFNHGVKMGLANLPGFRIHPQSAHDPRAVDPARPIVKCCNQAWHTQRVDRQVQIANRSGLWSRDQILKLVGPCQMLSVDKTCQHHGGRVRCAYLDQGFPLKLDELAGKLRSEPPVFDLRKARKAVQEKGAP